MVLKTTIFENMGMTYLGPVDGHDLPGLISLLRIARDIRGPVVIHAVTKKGCGYLPAESDPSRFHGIGKFDPATGNSIGGNKQTYSASFGQTMLELAKEDERICAITAAMPGGTGLIEFMKQYPKRTFDVGIAEEHAVSMAGGLAKQGMIPVVALYSTFLQRAFDQIMQDVALLGLHVVFAVDRAGLVGDDGATHHGVFDVGFLRQIPGITVLCPSSMAEQRDMLRWAVKDCRGPVAVRYPRGGDGKYADSCWNGTSSVVNHREGGRVALITYGNLLDDVQKAADKLKEQGIELEEGGSLLLQREICADGKNVCRVNGRPVGVVQLREIGASLLNIHGQHDGQKLLDEEQHGVFLDRFGHTDALLEALINDEGGIANG
jgi:1-deoxy-D-xylulose-5-phosphate synthase